MTWDDVSGLARGFPAVVETTSYGTPSLKVGKAFLLRLREPGVIAIKVTGLEVQELLLEAEPEMFFLTDHYRGYPFVLARLARLDADRFVQLFAAIWRERAPRKVVAAFDAQRDGIADK